MTEKQIEEGAKWILGSYTLVAAKSRQFLEDIAECINEPDTRDVILEEMRQLSPLCTDWDHADPAVKDIALLEMRKMAAKLEEVERKGL